MEKMISFDRKKAEYLLLIVIYRIFLDWAFTEVISTIFGYMGFHNERSNTAVIVSWVLLLGFSALFYAAFLNESKKISHETIYWLFLMSFIPFTSMVAFNDVSVMFTILETIYWLILGLLFLKLRIKRSGIRITIGSTKLIGEKQIQTITVLSMVVVLYISWRYTHFRINLRLDEVYDLRAEASTYYLPVILTYLYSWSRNVNSILIAYYIHRKKIGWVVACAFVQMLNFGIDGAKTTLFLMVFVVMINLIPRFNFEVLNKWILRGFVIITGFSTLIYKLWGGIWTVSLFVRRMLFVPIHISNNYVDFFTRNTPDFFRQSFLRYLGIKSPYPSIAYMIGDIYSHQVTSANNGLLSDAVANLGYAGVLIFPILLMIVFHIFDDCTEGLDPRIYITTALYASMTLTNSFLFTVLLTHGLIITMIILKMMKREPEVINEDLSSH